MSNNGYFDGDDLRDLGDSGLRNEDQLEEFTNANELEDFDAFNEETFAATGLGDGDGEDWEAEHDKLIMIENDGKIDTTLTKIEDAEEEDYEDAEGELERNDLNNYDSNNVAGLNKFDNNRLSTLTSSNISNQSALNNNISNNNNNNNGVDMAKNNNYLPQFQLYQQQLLLQQQLKMQLQFQQQQSQVQPPQIPTPTPPMQQQQQAPQQSQQASRAYQQHMNIFHETQTKLIQQLQLQQYLQHQMQQQQLKQNQALMQQLQLQKQLNSSTITNLIALRNNQLQILQKYQLQSGAGANNNGINAQNELLNSLSNNLINNNNNNNNNNNFNNTNINNNPINRKTPVNFMNNNKFNNNAYNNETFGNNDQPASVLNSNNDFLFNNLQDQGKLREILDKMTQLNVNNSNTNQNNNNSSMPNQQALQQQQLQQLIKQQQQQQQQQNLQQENKNNNQLLQSILQSQQQQQQQAQTHLQSNLSSVNELGKLPPVKALPNVKTLEEIENELFNQPASSNKSSSNQSQQSLNQMNNVNNPDISNLAKNYSQLLSGDGNNLANNPLQQQQLELLKLFPLLNNNSLNQNELQQKQILQALALQQQQQLLSANQNQPKLTDQQLLLQLQQQQQLAAARLNLNNLILPQNFQYLTQQQKQVLLAQRNIQASLLQQQMMQLQQQMQSNNNNNSMNNNNNSNIGNIPNSSSINELNLSALNNSSMNNSFNDNNNSMNENIENEYGNHHNHHSNHNNQNNNNNNNRRMNYNNRHQNNRNDPDRKRNYIPNMGVNLSVGDKLTGMMTDKEKGWVVNVQMLQLQIDDPYSYDFYYTAWMHKKKQFSMQNSNSSGLKTSVLFQSNNNKDPRNYRPLTFENSLGKVTMSNFHHPRALIDINQRSNDPNSSNTNSLPSHIDGLEEDDDENKSKETKNICSILLEIEKMYQVYLNIDEIEHKILKEPEETRASLFQERRSKVDKLASMMCSENFPHYLFVSKGKRLLGKCIPTFNASQTKLILGYFMQYIYIISKNNISLDEIYSQISYAIDTQKFNDIVDIINQFVHLYSRQSNQLYHTIFSNKFGLTYLLKFMSKSEMINQDDYDNDIKAIWSSYLNIVLTGLNTIQASTNSNESSPEWNIYEICQINFSTILENFQINSDLWSKNESKLKELFTPVDD